MIRKNNKNVYIIIILLIIAAFFRLYAYDWGIPQSGIFFDLPHPDETGTVNALKGINPATGNFIPKNGLYEGPFSYYIWYLVSVFLYLFGVIHSLPAQMNQSDFYIILSAGRITMGLCDVITAYLIFKILKLLNISQLLSLLGAVLYAFIPFTVMHSHYMRTHILLNTFIVSIIYYSLKYKENRTFVYAIILGLLCGSCFAARYPFGIVVSIPFLFIISDLLYSKKNVIQELFNKYNIVIIIFFIITFIVLVFTIVTDFQVFNQGIHNTIIYSSKDQFSGLNIFNVDKIIQYLIYVIPKSTYLLYIPLYLFSFIGLFFKANHKIYLPLFIFSVIYLYPLTKSYPLYAMRIILPVLPVLVITSILGVTQFLKLNFIKNIKNGIVYTIISLSLIATLFFDIAIVKGLNNKNPHQQLAEYIEQNFKNIKTILLYAPYWEWYEFENIRKLTFQQKGIKILDESQVIDQKINPDLIIVFQFEENKETNIAVEKIISNKFIKASELKRSFFIPLQCCGFSFDYSKMPHDFRYPFPKIFLYSLKNK